MFFLTLCFTLVRVSLTTNIADIPTITEPPPGFPVYQRGPVPNWLLPIDAREDGLTYLGTHARLRATLDRVSYL